jgi:VanZ family protein
LQAFSFVTTNLHSHPMQPDLQPSAFSNLIHAPRTWRTIFVLLIIAVGFLALTPQPPKSIDTGWDKLNHLLAFAALTFAASLSWPWAGNKRSVIIFGLVLFGGAIEVLQLSVPGRASEWRDLLADTIGIACGIALATSRLKHLAPCTVSTATPSR